MKLTLETVKDIKLGQVIRFKGVSALGQEWVEEGVLFYKETNMVSNKGVLIRCYRTNRMGYFGFGQSMFRGNVEFEIIDKEEPVDLYGVGCDFIIDYPTD